jgi:hypothetical protein
MLPNTVANERLQALQRRWTRSPSEIARKRGSRAFSTRRVAETCCKWRRNTADEGVRTLKPREGSLFPGQRLRIKAIKPIARKTKLSAKIVGLELRHELLVGDAPRGDPNNR